MRAAFSATLFFFFVTAAASAGNYATCILDRMPGTDNDVAAYAIAQTCTRENFGGLWAVKWGSGRGLFGYDSGAKCTAAKARKTVSQKAASAISMACHRLYDDFNINDCIGYQLGGPSYECDAARKGSQGGR